MANRNTLAISSLQGFKTFLALEGWKFQAPKGYYEMLRATKEGRKYPLIVYRRHDTNGGKELVHCTVLDRDMPIVRAFIKKKYIGEDTNVLTNTEDGE